MQSRLYLSFLPAVEVGKQISGIFSVCGWGMDAASFGEESPNTDEGSDAGQSIRMQMFIYFKHVMEQLSHTQQSREDQKRLPERCERRPR